MIRFWLFRNVNISLLSIVHADNAQAVEILTIKSNTKSSCQTQLQQRNSNKLKIQQSE